MEKKLSESFCEFVVSEFVDGVDKVIFVMLKDEIRLMFIGVFFEKEEDDFVNFVGMDGYRFVICKIKLIVVEGSFLKIVFVENLDDIIKIVDIEEVEKVRVLFFEN